VKSNETKHLKKNSHMSKKIYY